MKVCLICGALVTDASKTCPKCGEGSWSRSIEDMLEDASVKLANPAVDTEPLEAPKASDPKPMTHDKRDSKAKR